MKTMFCWRCQMDIPMMDETEYDEMFQLFGRCFHAKTGSMRERFRPVCEKYEAMSGFDETNHNAILHHRIQLYGPPCSQCGKPLRTQEATFCAECGAGV